MKNQRNIIPYYEFKDIDQIEVSLLDYLCNNNNRNKVIKELTIAIMDDHNDLSLFFLRGFNYLMKSEFKKAIKDFSNLISRKLKNNNMKIFPRLQNKENIDYLYLDELCIYRSHFFRAIAFISIGEMKSAFEEERYLIRSDISWNYRNKIFLIYPIFVKLFQSLYSKKYDIALEEYSRIRDISVELFDYEKELFKLLPNKEEKFFSTSIKLLNLSLGISL